MRRCGGASFLLQRERISALRYYILDDVVDPDDGGNLSVSGALVEPRPGPPQPKCRNWCGLLATTPDAASESECRRCQNLWIVTGTLASDAHVYPIVNGIPRLVFSGTHLDRDTQESFGYEWKHFSHVLSEYDEEARNYFHLVPDEMIRDAVVLDAGCGMGRWARYVAGRSPRRLYAVDFSEAIDSAAQVLASQGHAHCVQGDVTRLPFRPETFAFGYCLGVLHHLESPDSGLAGIVRVLKRDAAILLYLYYALENRPATHRGLLKLVTMARRVTSALPKRLMHLLAIAIAIVVYWPLSRFAGLLELVGAKRLADAIPLSHYQRLSFRFLIGDAFDRFATPIERRYTRDQILAWVGRYGYGATFSDRTPFWVALAQRL
jgi:SAM-dependent methyltransferase